MKYIIREQECGYLMKNGRFIKLLTAGKYQYPRFLGYEVLTVPMTGEVDNCGIPCEILMQQEAFSGRVVKVQLPDTSIALHFVNQAFQDVVVKPETYYWNVFQENTFRIIDITAPYRQETLPRMYIDLLPVKDYKKIVIKEGEAGLLYFDNRFEKRLDQGTHFFWNYGKEVTCRIYNLKIQQLEIGGQEILTADKVSVRLNVTVNYRITEPERLAGITDEVGKLLYTFAQLTIRDYIGRFRLDELLAQKDEIGEYIFRKLQEEQNRYCMEILSAGIKDIILPGEIRDIMNSVLAAEKKAQANVIMRREEVASTRSLLNTARLMEENQTLYKLKEMEYLEKICDKVGTITLGGGRGVLEQLAELVH